MDSFGEFDPTRDPLASWLVRLEKAFKRNNVETDEDKVSWAHVRLGSAAAGFIDDLPADITWLNFKVRVQEDLGEGTLLKQVTVQLDYRRQLYGQLNSRYRSLLLRHKQTETVAEQAEAEAEQSQAEALAWRDTAERLKVAHEEELRRVSVMQRLMQEMQAATTAQSETQRQHEAQLAAAEEQFGQQLTLIKQQMSKVHQEELENAKKNQEEELSNMRESHELLERTQQEVHSNLILNRDSLNTLNLTLKEKLEAEREKLNGEEENWRKRFEELEAELGRGKKREATLEAKVKEETNARNNALRKQEEVTEKITQSRKVEKEELNDRLKEQCTALTTTLPDQNRQLEKLKEKLRDSEEQTKEIEEKKKKMETLRMKKETAWRDMMAHPGGGNGPRGRNIPHDGEEKAKMFVGGLSWETTQESLQRYFDQYGEVIDCVVIKNSETGRSRGFGFVTFTDPNKLDSVLKSGPHELDGRTIDPKTCNPRSMQKQKRNGNWPKVFLGGLPSNLTETDLRNFFSRFGGVMEVVIIFDREKKKSRGFGFLSFETEEAVNRAVAEHFVNINGKQVEIKKAKPRDANKVQDEGGQWDTHPDNQWGMPVGPPGMPRLNNGMGPGNMGPPLGHPLGPHNSQMGGHIGTQGMVQSLSQLLQTQREVDQVRAEKLHVELENIALNAEMKKLKSGNNLEQSSGDIGKDLDPVDGEVSDNRFRDKENKEICDMSKSFNSDVDGKLASPTSDATKENHQLLGRIPCVALGLLNPCIVTPNLSRTLCVLMY